MCLLVLILAVRCKIETYTVRRGCICVGLCWVLCGLIKLEKFSLYVEK